MMFEKYDKPYFSAAEKVSKCKSRRCAKCQTQLDDQQMHFWGHFDNVPFEIYECLECAGTPTQTKTSVTAFYAGPLFQ